MMPFMAPPVARRDPGRGLELKQAALAQCAALYSAITSRKTSIATEAFG